jgi:hypothetical protein
MVFLKSCLSCLFYSVKKIAPALKSAFFDGFGVKFTQSRGIFSTFEKKLPNGSCG